MSAQVNLLLLLSALLSALTGVSGGARQPQAATAVVQQVRATTVRRAAAQAAARPAEALQMLADVAPGPIVAALVLAAAEPIYATRLRE